MRLLEINIEIDGLALFFLMFHGGLNDSCLISSNALKLSSLRVIMLLSGERCLVSAREVAVMPEELQGAKVGCSGTERVALYPPPRNSVPCPNLPVLKDTS